jgi:hypothetical protein
MRLIKNTKSDINFTTFYTDTNTLEMYFNV